GCRRSARPHSRASYESPTHLKRRRPPKNPNHDPELKYQPQHGTKVIKASDASPSRYLQTSVVKGKPIVAVISHVEMETVGQGADQKRKPVLYLDGQKPMVLNRTNFETLADAFGDSDDGAGNKVKGFTA